MTTVTIVQLSNYSDYSVVTRVIIVIRSYVVSTQRIRVTINQLTAANLPHCRQQLPAVTITPAVCGAWTEKCALTNY